MKKSLLPNQSAPVMRSNLGINSQNQNGVGPSGLACTICKTACNALSGIKKTACLFACDHTVC